VLTIGMVVGEAAVATVVAVRAVVTARVGAEVVMAAAGDADEVDVVAVVVVGVVGVAVAAGEIAAIRAGALVAVRRW